MWGLCVDISHDGTPPKRGRGNSARAEQLPGRLEGSVALHLGGLMAYNWVERVFDMLMDDPQLLR